MSPGAMTRCLLITTAFFCLAACATSQSDFGDARPVPIGMEDGASHEAAPSDAAPISSTPAATPSETSGPRFAISIYGWLSDVSGTATTDGESTDFDIPVSELAERTNSALQGVAQVRWEGFFLRFDGTWADLEGEMNGRLITDLDVEIEQRIFDCTFGGEVYHVNLDEGDTTVDPGWQRHSVIDVLVGARYFYTKVSADTEWFTGKKADTSSTTTRWDPFVGVTWYYHLGEHWPLRLHGDIGGFGIGNAAKLTWQLEAEVGYRIWEWCTVFLGYRALDYDVEEGSGDDQNGTDILQHGPTIGVGFTF